MKPLRSTWTLQGYRTVFAGALALLLTASAYAAAPGIQGVAFNLTAKAAFLTQPDGQAIYSWGYGCTGNAPGSAKFMPDAISGTFCNDMQVPGPTLIVTEGDGKPRFLPQYFDAALDRDALVLDLQPRTVATVGETTSEHGIEAAVR